MKAAMVRVAAGLAAAWPHCGPGPGTRPGAWLVLQLHDELIYEVRQQ